MPRPSVMLRNRQPSNEDDRQADRLHVRRAADGESLGEVVQLDP
jgi:hypothetical protein